VQQIGRLAQYFLMNCQKRIKELSALTAEQQKQHVM
jgi:hypothetical protein